MIQTGTKKLTLAAMFFAIGIILPFFIGQISVDRTDASSDAYSGPCCVD